MVDLSTPYGCILAHWRCDLARNANRPLICLLCFVFLVFFSSLSWYAEMLCLKWGCVDYGLLTRVRGKARVRSLSGYFQAYVFLLSHCDEWRLSCCARNGSLDEEVLECQAFARQQDLLLHASILHVRCFA